MVVGDMTEEERKRLRNDIQYAIEGIILRRLHENEVSGYTLPMAMEIADLVMEKIK